MKRNEFFHGSIIFFFDVFGEITSRQLVLTPVVSHTLTANPLAGARIVRAIAVLLVSFDLTFHQSHLP